MPKPLNAGSELIQKAKQNLTTSEEREWATIQATTSTMWRNFWAKVLHNKGHSNVTIAKELQIGETTVRNILKK